VLVNVRHHLPLVYKLESRHLNELVDGAGGNSVRIEGLNVSQHGRVANVGLVACGSIDEVLKHWGGH